MRSRARRDIPASVYIRNIDRETVGAAGDTASSAVLGAPGPRTNTKVTIGETLVLVTRDTTGGHNIPYT